MWPISNLAKKFRDWQEQRAFEAEIADRPFLPLYRIVTNKIIDFYLLH